MIPKLHYISQGKSKAEQLENIQKACSAGAEMLRLSFYDFPKLKSSKSAKMFLELATEAREITSHFQTRLIITSHYKIAKEVKADGVHLNQKDDSPTVVRKNLYTWQMIGATANTLEECENLISKEVDYIYLGPFRKSEVEENTGVILGLNGFTAITEILNTEIPIIGFGGITTEDVTDILGSGISGIAVSDQITQDFNSIKTFNQLLNDSSTAEQRHSFK
ncbi:thiamine-phosphate pyrophosphorylase [Flavobacteriaceae bacterium MAR_2010_188]|nr:thiamine-phosphate pyrophosphorylase [Flavobacteriaceae bacterium MAR_2010_188]